MFSSNVQIYELLPAKSPQHGHYVENGENCIVADDITHNGIVYTPKQDLGDDDASSVFKVIPPGTLQSWLMSLC